MQGARARAVFLLAVSALACGSQPRLPEDDNLEAFVRTTAEAVYLDRAYSAEVDVLKTEMSRLTLPTNWDSLPDLLLHTYGSDPGFWYAVYAKIDERSRK